MKKFLEDLRRRKVLPAALTYAAIGWVLLQAASIILPALLLPAWTLRFLLVLVIVGFPLAVTLAWSDRLHKANWARLLQKVYEVDPLECPNCGAAMGGGKGTFS